MKTTVFFVLVLTTVFEIEAKPYSRERYSLDGGDGKQLFIFIPQNLLISNKFNYKF